MIAIVDYQAGNIGSVANSLSRLNVDFQVTNESDKIKKSDGVIFPGQGRAGPAMKSLRSSGLDEVLIGLEQPFLGICLGMQLMVETLDEDDQKGLGIIPGSCEEFKDVSPVPHMGWNTINIATKSQLTENISDNSFFYFVHSYAIKTTKKYILATTEYGGEFVSAIQKDNYYGVQFHPEKSAEIGEKMLKNFLKICEGAKK